jgi:hypothetical protein
LRVGLCALLAGLEIAKLIARETLRNAALRSWVWIPVMLDFFWPYIEMLYMGVVGISNFWHFVWSRD